jgi:hypothetical protein
MRLEQIKSNQRLSELLHSGYEHNGRDPSECTIEECRAHHIKNDTSAIWTARVNSHYDNLRRFERNIICPNMIQQVRDQFRQATIDKHLSELIRHIAASAATDTFTPITASAAWEAVSAKAAARDIAVACDVAISAFVANAVVCKNTQFEIYGNTITNMLRRVASEGVQNAYAITRNVARRANRSANGKFIDSITRAAAIVDDLKL